MTPLVEELIPCPDPWDVARKLSHLPHLLFLDSAVRHTERGRYSYVMADPTRQISESGMYTPTPGWTLFEEFSSGHFPFTERPCVPGIPPFQGGYAGLFNYELAGEVERLPLTKCDEYSFTDSAILGYYTLVSFDHLLRKAWIVSAPDHSQTSDAALQTAAIRMNWFRSLLNVDNEPNAIALTSPSYLDSPIIQTNFTREQYLAAVRKCIEYIHAGDIFQVNLSQRLLAPLTEHPLELYGRLRKVSPAPFACYFDAGDFQIASASPERFLQVTADREIITQPIKGTRPRGKSPTEDAALIADLLANPKDRAENVMIVDLLRNDIGKVAEYGSVHVPRICELESYRHVHHLVSEVRGRLRADKTPFDLLKAAFPGGSVTGAPKVRAMEIIAELEPTARGPYCGSIGFIGFDGVMDTNILIRTFTAGRGWLQFPVGGGIVADSSPEAEYQETLDKAAGLLKALRKA